MEENSNLLEMTADMFSAYVSNNTVSPEGVAALIGTIHSTMTQLSTGGVQPEPNSSADDGGGD